MMFKLDLFERYFRKNPIYYLDSIRYERQKYSAVKREESLPSDRWIQFWGVILTVLAVAVTVYIVKERRYYESEYFFMHYFSLILVEAIFLCSLMISIVWEGFSSFKRDMESGVFETIMITLLEPKKIVWGKFLHVFIHFIKFSLLGFIILLLVSPVSLIHPVILLILMALNISAGAFMISQRIYMSANEAFYKVRKKYNGKEINQEESEREIPKAVKFWNSIEKGASYLFLGLVFTLAQFILLTNYVGEGSLYPGFLSNFVNRFPHLFIFYLFLPCVFLLLVFTWYFQKKTEKLIGEII